MKKLLLCFLFFCFTIICVGQVNSVGKTKINVIWDIIGTQDTIIRSVYANQWYKGDTLVLSVYNVVPETLLYHRLYYFVDDICVHQRIITFKQNTISNENVVINKIEEYNAQLTPINNESTYYPKTINPMVKNKMSYETVLPSDLPKNSFIIINEIY
jgi:hypothetical protein